MPLEEFLSLNPQHNRPVIAGADEASILLPYDKAGLFAAKLELSDQPMVTWQAYKLKAGETLQQVATRFGLPLETLRAVNGIGPRAVVPVNHTLLVPSQLPSSATAATLQSAVFTMVPEGRTFYHRVRKSETLYGIAARYHVSVQELKAWNPDVKGEVDARAATSRDQRCRTRRQVQARRQEPQTRDCRGGRAPENRPAAPAARHWPPAASAAHRANRPPLKQNRRHLRVACFGVHRSCDGRIAA